MRCQKLVVLAAAILIPSFADVGSADQRATVSDGPVACNSACRWWMALGKQPAPEQTREAVTAAPTPPPPATTAAHAPAIAAAALQGSAHRRSVAVTTRLMESRGSTGQIRTTVAQAEPPLPPRHPAAPTPPAVEPAAPIPVAPLPVAAPLVVADGAAPGPVATGRAAFADDAPAASPVSVTEDRADRAGLGATPDRAPPSVAVSMQAEQALLTPRRARNGLMAGAFLCAVTVSLRRAGRTRVAAPVDRRNEPPLLDAFKASRRTAAPQT